MYQILFFEYLIRNLFPKFLEGFGFGRLFHNTSALLFKFSGSIRKVEAFEKPLIKSFH